MSKTYARRIRAASYGAACCDRLLEVKIELKDALVVKSEPISDDDVGGC